MKYNIETKLDISGQNLTEFPDLSMYKNLTHLYCSNNKLKEIKNLPDGLIVLDCSFNKLTEIKNLPDSLVYLSCYNNQIKELNNLPKSLNYLYCYFNELTELNNLPKSLNYLICSHNKITKMHFPKLLKLVYCSYNQLSELNLYNSSIEINFHDNPLKYDFIISKENIIKFNKFKYTYYRMKCCNKLERFYLRYRCNRYKEELIMSVFHPRRIMKIYDIMDELY